jgi:SAM-dependent methyltransferase
MIDFFGHENSYKNSYIWLPFLHMRKIIPLFINLIPQPWLIRISMVFMRFASVFYHGDQVECPVCGGRFRKFLPYGYNQVRKNVLCPKCLSLERHRLLWLFLKNRTDFFNKPLKVLHVAPEQCFHRIFRKMPHLTYVTADIESPLADVKLDIQNMPFPEAEFDMVICNHVLEHVPDDRKAIREVFRVLKSGGSAILQVPTSYTMEHTYEDPSITSPADREKHFRQKDHYRLYGKDYLQRLTEAGFRIPEKNYLDELTQDEKERYRLPVMEYMYGYLK